MRWTTIHRANSGAITEKIIQIMPQLAKEISAPLQRTGTMVFISGDGRGRGPSQLTDKMNKPVAQVPETVNAFTGVDLWRALAAFGKSGGSDALIQGVAEGGSKVMDTACWTKGIARTSIFFSL